MCGACDFPAFPAKLPPVWLTDCALCAFSCCKAIMLSHLQTYARDVEQTVIAMDCRKMKAHFVKMSASLTSEGNVGNVLMTMHSLS